MAGVGRLAVDGLAALRDRLALRRRARHGFLDFPTPPMALLRSPGVDGFGEVYSGGHRPGAGSACPPADRTP